MRQHGGDDITDRTRAARAFVEKQLERARLGFFVPVDYAHPIVFNGLLGGSDWPGSAFDPRSGLLYVAANHTPWIITLKNDDDPPPLQPATTGEQVYQQFCAGCHGLQREGIAVSPPLLSLRHRLNDDQVIAMIAQGRGAMPPLPLTDAQRKPLLDFLMARDRGGQAPPAESITLKPVAFDGYKRLLDDEGYPGSKPPWSTLNCLDLNTRKIIWRVPLGEYEALTRAGISKTGTESLGGATDTAGGLVFCGGTKDKKFQAFDTATGEELWSGAVPAYGATPPTVYEVSGRQFVVIGASGGGHLSSPAGDSWVAYSLPLDHSSSAP